MRSPCVRVNGQQRTLSTLFFFLQKSDVGWTATKSGKVDLHILSPIHNAHATAKLDGLFLYTHTHSRAPMYEDVDVCVCVYIYTSLGKGQTLFIWLVVFALLVLRPL